MHVVQRGHNRNPSFLQDRDYELYLGLLNEFRGMHGCAIHAFVLMTNHVHLLLTPREAGGVSALMRRLGMAYVAAMNRRYGRTGSGGEGRFWASVVDSSSYLLTCHRYIELNPVRAGLVKRPEGYRWSSHRHNAYGAALPMIEPHAEYLALGSDEDKRRSAYRRLFSAPISDAEMDRIRVALRSNLPIGGEEFLSELEQQLARPMTRRRAGRKRRHREEPRISEIQELDD
jgi:putative transposase